MNDGITPLDPRDVPPGHQWGYRIDRPEAESIPGVPDNANVAVCRRIADGPPLAADEIDECCVCEEPVWRSKSARLIAEADGGMYIVCYQCFKEHVPGVLP